MHTKYMTIKIIITKTKTTIIHVQNNMHKADSANGHHYIPPPAYGLGLQKKGFKLTTLTVSDFPSLNTPLILYVMGPSLFSTLAGPNHRGASLAENLLSALDKG